MKCCQLQSSDVPFVCVMSYERHEIAFEMHLMQSYLAMALDRRLQEDWAKDAGESPRVLMSLRVDFGAMG